MPFTNVPIQNIESFQPAIDYRRSGRIGVLAGKNFAWDASGVYSAYASRLVSGSDSISTNYLMPQSLDLEDAIHVATAGEIRRFLPSSPDSQVGSWELLDTLAESQIPDPKDVPYDYRKWTSAYLGGQRYACSWNYGVFRVDLDALPIPTYTQLTSGAPVGFPNPATDPVIAIAETSGRMLYLTATTIYWSGPADPEDLTPALGGAGFQVIAERISGRPFALTPVASGVVIWTDSGALVGEFVGGDIVFRWYELASQTLPISAFAITQLPDDSYILLTRLGLFTFTNLNLPQPITPVFNEFLREYLRIHPNEYGHVWYSVNDNRLYVGFKEINRVFFITYALEITLDRWGTFNEQQLGLFEYGLTRGLLAYANLQGVASVLLSPRDARKNRENANDPGTFIGLGSEILIGWIRAENLIPHADTIQELQEIVVNRLASNDQVEVTFYDEGFVDEAVDSNVDEGLIGALPLTFFDEGLINQSGITNKYKLEVWTDLTRKNVNGNGSNIFSPILAVKNDEIDLWTMTIPSYYHRLRFIATEADEYFRVNSLDVTLYYTGHQS